MGRVIVPAPLGTVFLEAALRHCELPWTVWLGEYGDLWVAALVLIGLCSANGITDKVTVSKYKGGEA